ncbi:unnamed protein product [Bursaphelenchus okinawaensis]|uniref:Tetraspanin n=1 Tax=Bursaphelenchus okinawaensis TaxID=465554 RepID=A0A811KIU0_9BILA|nr:unnamed protein product [Bursaphelenchus okinawaensis]CAG9103720.1 unnamed protein product [Bursaphelenchus okinawaensis]
MGSFSRWTAYGAGGRCLRLSYLSTNLLSVMLAGAVFVYGCWMYHNYSEYAELLAPSLYVDVSRIMIVVTLLAIFNAVVSTYGVFKELRCMIYSFSIASIIIFIMLFIGGVMGFVFQYKLRHQIPLDLKMYTSLRELYGNEEWPDVTRAWDSLQTNFRCCGVNGTDDWRIWGQSKWHMHLKNETKPKMPDSCCPSGSEEHCRNSHLTSITNTPIYSETCYKPLKKQLLFVVNTASWLLIVESGVLLIPAFFAAMYARLIKK